MNGLYRSDKEGREILCWLFNLFCIFSAFICFMDEKNLKRKKKSSHLAICCARDICNFCVVLAVLTCPCHDVFFAYGIMLRFVWHNVWEMWLTSCICQYSHTFLYPLYNFVGRDRLASKKSNLDDNDNNKEYTNLRYQELNHRNIPSKLKKNMHPFSRYFLPSFNRTQQKQKQKKLR